MLALGAGLAIARAFYLGSVPASASADAAAAAFDILVRFIKTALRTLLVAGLIVAVGALFTGPSAAAVRTRSAFSAGLGRLRRGGESAGPAGAWTYAHRHGLRIAAVALAALIFVFWGRPTAAVTIVIAVLLLLALGLIELIGRPPPQPHTARYQGVTRGPRNRNQAPMTPIGGAGGEAASFTEDGSGAPPARPVVDSGDPRLDCRDARDAGAPTLMGRAGLLLLSGVAADGPGQPWTAGVHAPAACVLLFRAVQGRPGAPVTSHNSCG